MAQTTIKQRQIAGGLDGWIPAEQTWTYASATTITVPSGAASKYQKGDKIKITNNSATKYFYVVGVADTVLTVTGGSDYTVHDSAITNPYFSKIENPQGFPDWFSYVVPLTASGGTAPTYTGVDVGKFNIKGKTCHLQFYKFNSSGGTAGSGAVNLYFTLPITAVTTKTAGDTVPAGIGHYYNGVNAFLYSTIVSTSQGGWKLADTGFLTAVAQNQTVRIVSAEVTYEI